RRRTPRAMAAATSGLTGLYCLSKASGTSKRCSSAAGRCANTAAAHGTSYTNKGHIQRCRQVRHDGGGKVPTVSQGRGQLMADTATQAGFGYSDGQVVPPEEGAQRLVGV